MPTKAEETERLAKIKRRYTEFRSDHRNKIKTNGFVHMPARVVAEDMDFLLKIAETAVGPIPEPAEADEVAEVEEVA